MAKAITLVDDFNDDLTSTSLWVVVPAGDAVREVNGRVEMFPPSGSVGNFLYASAAMYDLTESEVRLEIVRVPRMNPNLTLGLAAVPGGAGPDSVQITVGNGQLRAEKQVAGVTTILRQIPYDPAAHRWVRLSETAGTTFWEYAADGVHYTSLYQAPDPVALTSVQLDFGLRLITALPSPGFAAFDNFNVPNTARSRRVEERRLSARQVRVGAADLDAARLHEEHFNNNDEVNYAGRPFIGNYSKSLKHDSLGDPDPISYGTLLRALQSRDTHDFEEIQLASSTAVKLTNPQTGLTFEIEGVDPQEITQPPAPRFDSAVTAHEAGELYWMAVARDVPFVNYGSDATIGAAISSLNSEFPLFGGTTPVTTQNVFRGIYPGEQVGPYVSQLLVKGNQDPRKPVGLGRDALDGRISYGARSIDQRIIPAVANADYLTTFSTWLDVQNGVDKRGQDTFDTQRRYIHTLRAGATMVHFDEVIDSWYNAAWYLMSEPTGNQLSGSTARPQIDLEFPKDQGNPYDPPGTAMDSKTQVGFGTFGPIHVLQTLGEALGRAIRAVWWQKWGVHRRLRPEEYGGRVHNQITGARTYPLHSSIVTSLQTGGLAPYFGNAGEKFPSSYLLPQAYPEGAPTHPAYGAGHATGSGAMATILKAFFDETTAIENPVVPAADGLSLLVYTGSGASSMTIGGEINKLAGNVALFRNAAGVHWRTDYTESLLLGEAVAIGLLQEQSLGFQEDDGYFQLTRFDGVTIRIFDGQVVPVA
ncbi:MAG: Vanadium haloperoxidase [Gemmatimonadetes bacterium]|nr:Vanadium haloperoxidase [Gemmatimonadota bacterium]